MSVRCSPIVLFTAVLVASQSRVPRGFKRYENKLAGVRFCYPLAYKQVPLKPTERVLHAQYYASRPPRELRKLGKRYKSREPRLWVFSYDKSKPMPLDAIERLRETKAKAKGPKILAYLRRGLPLWEAAAVAGKPGHYTLSYPFSDAAIGQKRVGYLVLREEGNLVLGCFGVTVESYAKTLEKLVTTMATTVERTTGTARSHVSNARLDKRYEGKDLLGIAKRKAVIAKLATGWRAVDTPHYIIVSNSPSNMLIRRVAREIEAMRKAYERVLPPKKPIEAVSVVRVCKTLSDYHRYGGRPGTGGYFNFVQEELVLFDYAMSQRKEPDLVKKYLGGKVGEKDTALVLYHEAMHQYVHYAAGDVIPHDWFNEGLGDYFSGAINPGVGNRVPRIGPSRWRLDLAREQCKYELRFVPLKKLLHAERAEFYHPRRISDYYAAAWSFVWFLKKADRVRAHKPWATLLDVYFDTLTTAYAKEIAKQSGKPDLRAQFKASFEARKVAIAKALDGIDLDELETAWKTWTANLK